MNPGRAEVGPEKSNAEANTYFEDVIKIKSCQHDSAKQSSNILHLTGHRISIWVLPITGIRAIKYEFYDNILRLWPDSLPGILMKGLSEMSFEDCKILEHLDHQGAGINLALKLLKSGEKSNNCVFFLKKVEAVPESTESTIETTAVALDQGKIAAEAPSFREVCEFHFLGTIPGTLTISEVVLLTET